MIMEHFGAYLEALADKWHYVELVYIDLNDQVKWVVRNFPAEMADNDTVKVLHGRDLQEITSRIVEELNE